MNAEIRMPFAAAPATRGVVVWEASAGVVI